MKIILLTAALFLTISISLSAQDSGKSIITVSFGLLPTENVIADALLYRYGFLPKDKSMKVRNGAVFVSFKHHISDRFALGSTLGYNGNADVNGYLFSLRKSTRRQALTSAMEGTFFWLQREKIQMYSMAGAGMFAKKIIEGGLYERTAFGPTIQISPAGIRFGERVGVFVELGYGYKGFLNSGFSWKI